MLAAGRDSGVQCKWRKGLAAERVSSERKAGVMKLNPPVAGSSFKMLG